MSRYTKAAEVLRAYPALGSLTLWNTIHAA